MTASLAQPAVGLNPTQMHLLHLFSKKMSDQELKELKKLLVEWYDQKAQEIMDKIWAERGMTQKKMDEMLKKISSC